MRESVRRMPSPSSRTRSGVTGRLAGADVDVVAVEGDVELAERDLGAAQVGDSAAQPLRDGHASRVDPDEGDALEIRVALDDLVCDPRQRALDRLGIEDSLGFRGLRAHGALRAQIRPAVLTYDSFPASQDRVKGVLYRRRTLAARADGAQSTRT